MWHPYPTPVKGQVHHEAEYLFHRNTGETLYPCVVDGLPMKLTAKEYYAAFPDRHKLPESREISQRKNMHLQICRRISRRFREKECESKVASELKHAGFGAALERKSQCTYNSTIRKLVKLFFDMFVSEGYRGLPVKMLELDPYNTDDEYENRVITEYCKKPWNYESERTMLLADEVRKAVSKKGTNPSAARARAREYIREKEATLAADITVREPPVQQSPQPLINLDEFQKRKLKQKCPTRAQQKQMQREQELYDVINVQPKQHQSSTYAQHVGSINCDRQRAATAESSAGSTSAIASQYPQKESQNTGIIL